MPSFVFLSLRTARSLGPHRKWDEKKKNLERRSSLESHVNRTLYLHGPSQCKIEILLMEILTKRPFFHWTFSLNITLDLFTSLQCIQNTLLVAASSQTDKYGRFWSRSKGGREQKRKSCPLKQISTLDPIQILNICVYIRGKSKKGLVARMTRALSEKRTLAT